MSHLKAKHGGRKISKLAKIHGAYSVKVGVVRGTGVHPKAKGATIAQIAWWNEFGTSIRFGRSGGSRITIPERPFLRWTMRENRYYSPQMRRMLQKIMLLQTTMDQGLKTMGAKAASDIRKMITNGPFVPNAPATTRKKSTSSGVKNRPLIDTGLLRRSISYQLSHEMGRRMVGGD